MRRVTVIPPWESVYNVQYAFSRGYQIWSPRMEDSLNLMGQNLTLLKST